LLNLDFNTDYSNNFNTKKEDLEKIVNDRYGPSDQSSSNDIDLSNQLDNNNNNNNNNSGSNSDDFESVNTIFANDDKDSSSNNKIDLSDQTGESYNPSDYKSNTKEDLEKEINKRYGDGGNSKNEIDLMKDLTGNSYDPTNNNQTTKEELQKTINERYPESNKTDFNQTNYNSKTATDEEINKSDGYSYLDDYKLINYQQAKEDHRLETEDIQQITEQQRRSQSPENILQQRSEVYQTAIDRNEKLAKDFRESQKKYSFWGGVKQTFTNILKGGLLGGTSGAVSGGINTAFNYGVNTIGQDQYTEKYYEQKDKNLDSRFDMSVEDWSNIPDGPTVVDYDDNSTRYLEDDNRSISDRYHSKDGEVVRDEDQQNNDQQNNDQSGNDQSGNDQNGDNTGGNNTDGIADLLTWFMLNDGEEEENGSGSGSGSNTGGSTTNVITAGSQSEDQQSFKKYIPYISFAGVVLGLIFLGGE